MLLKLCMQSRRRCRHREVKRIFPAKNVRPGLVTCGTKVRRGREKKTGNNVAPLVAKVRDEVHAATVKEVELRNKLPTVILNLRAAFDEVERSIVSKVDRTMKSLQLDPSGQLDMAGGANMSLIRWRCGSCCVARRRSTQDVGGRPA